MALGNSDILFGKLAIGRKYVSRESAIAIANQVDASRNRGRAESFSQAAGRLGYLQPGRIAELLEVLRTGTLLCRGSCGETYQLGSMSAEDTVACGRCGGPLYVRRPLPGEAPSVEPTTEEQGSTTFLELSAVDVMPPGPVAESAPEPVPPQVLPPELPSAILHPPKTGEEEGDAAATFLDIEDDLDTILTPAHPATDPAAATALDLDGPAPTGTAQFPLDGETTTAWASGEAGFEPFAIGGLLALTPIGKGGMGTVYRARDQATQEIRALKILSDQADLNEEVLARFKREVLLSSRLSHPNIVRVYEAGLVDEGEQAGRPYYTMAYVHGRDLRGWAQERSRTPAEAVAMVVPICHAMHYAHSNGVIHRDLKPGNVLVALDGDRPLICDFGLAKYRADMQNLTRTGDILGTPSYMPPEQALGNRQKIGPPTDTYAIGAILYFLLTDRPPFTAPSAFATINKVVREAPTAPSEHNPAVPPALEQVVLKALSKEPVDRYHTGADLAAALEAAVG